MSGTLPKGPHMSAVRRISEIHRKRAQRAIRQRDALAVALSDVTDRLADAYAGDASDKRTADDYGITAAVARARRALARVKPL